MDRLAGLLAEQFAHHPLRVAVDGASVSGRHRLADELVDRLRVRSRPAVRVCAEDFLRPAAVRLERGRDDPDAFYADRLDAAGLQREVLDPLGPGGSARYLPTLWDPTTDRASRAAYAEATSDAVVLVDGAFLLTGTLSFDLSVHLHLSPAALRRRVAPADAERELPAYARYAREVTPAEVADYVVLLDDPRRPALRIALPTG